VGTRRELLYPGPAAERAKGNFQVMIVDGLVAGVWHQRRSGRRLDITVESLVDLSPGQEKELREQVERVGLIQEAVPTLTMGEVTTGGHA
jgi:hypothetical protein